MTISNYVQKRNERFYNRATKKFITRRNREDVSQQLATEQHLANVIAHFGNEDTPTGIKKTTN